MQKVYNNDMFAYLFTKINKINGRHSVKARAILKTVRNFTAVFILTAALFGAKPLSAFNPQDHVPGDVDIYIEVAPLENLIAQIKEFFFELMKGEKEQAEIEWSKLENMTSMKTSVNLFNPKELYEMGFDVKKPLGFGIITPKVASHESKQEEPVFVIIIPARDSSMLYKALYVRSGQQWEEYVNKQELETDLEVIEIRKDELALIDPKENFFMGKGEDYIVISNSQSQTDVSLKKIDKPMSTNEDFLELSNYYMKKKRSNGAIFTTFYSHDYLFNEAKKVVESAKVPDQFKSAFGKLRSDFDSIFSTFHLTKSGIKYVSISGFNEPDEKKASIRDMYKREPFLSIVDKIQKDPFLYMKIQYNLQAFFSFMAELGMPIRMPVNQSLQKALGKIARSQPEIDLTQWIGSNVSFYVGAIPEMTKANGKKQFEGALSFQIDQSKSGEIRDYMNSLKDYNDKNAEETNTEVKYAKKDNQEEWTIIYTQQPKMRRSEEGADAPKEKPIKRVVKVILQQEEMIIVFGNADILKTGSTTLLQKTGKIKSHDNLYFYVYINIASILDAIEEEKSTFTKSPVWQFIVNIKELIGIEYVEDNYSISEFEVKLGRK